MMNGGTLDNQDGLTPGETSYRVPSTAFRDKTANVRGNERVGSGVAGACFFIWGMRRQGVLGVIAMAGGLGLLARAVTGRCALKRTLAPSSLTSSIARSQGWSSAKVTSAAITIARPREEVYKLWRDFSSLPRFMTDIESIEVLSPRRSRWTVKAPLGQTVTWTSFVTQDIENERIAWESEACAEVPNFGSVRFHDAPGARGTEVSALIAYQPPYREAGRLLSTLLRETPRHQMRSSLRRLKQIMETGEIAVSQTNLEP